MYVLLMYKVRRESIDIWIIQCLLILLQHYVFLPLSSSGQRRGFGMEVGFEGGGGWGDLDKETSTAKAEL